MRLRKDTKGNATVLLKSTNASAKPNDNDDESDVEDFFRLQPKLSSRARASKRSGSEDESSHDERKNRKKRKVGKDSDEGESTDRDHEKGKKKKSKRRHRDDDEIKPPRKCARLTPPTPTSAIFVIT